MAHCILLSLIYENFYHWHIVSYAYYLREFLSLAQCMLSVAARMTYRLQYSAAEHRSLLSAAIDRF